MAKTYSAEDMARIGQTVGSVVDESGKNDPEYQQYVAYATKSGAAQVLPYMDWKQLQTKFAEQIANQKKAIRQSKRGMMDTAVEKIGNAIIPNYGKVSANQRNML